MDWSENNSLKFRNSTVSREEILRPFIFDSMGELQGKSILEVGCGGGYWTRLFSSHGAFRCIGIDSSAHQIEIANVDVAQTNISFAHADGTAFEVDNPVDIVFIDHVISELSSDTLAIKIVRQAHKNLVNRGKIILLEAHPSVLNFCFDSVTTTDSYTYFTENAEIIAEVQQPSGARFEIRNHHKTMGYLASLLVQNGFLIDGIIEPRYNGNSDNPYLVKRSQYPSHMIISARKYE